jgi:hypothetical protein
VVYSTIDRRYHHANEPGGEAVLQSAVDASHEIVVMLD